MPAIKRGCQVQRFRSIKGDEELRKGSPGPFYYILVMCLPVTFSQFLISLNLTVRHVDTSQIKTSGFFLLSYLSTAILHGKMPSFRVFCHSRPRRMYLDSRHELTCFGLRSELSVSQGFIAKPLRRVLSSCLCKSRASESRLDMAVTLVLEVDCSAILIEH